MSTPRRTRVYIAGPMTGLPEFNRPAFAAEAERLEKAGMVVLTPHILPDGLEYGQYMDITMAMLRAVDCVACLPGWRNSRGATAEIAYAECLGKHIDGALS